ncbi:MAG: GGDEF domain-containing protein [Desulfosarcinaceae bacterium]
MRSEGYRNKIYAIPRIAHFSKSTAIHEAIKIAMTITCQPNTKLLSRLYSAEPFCLGAVGFIAAVILCGWLVPAIGDALPVGWSLMKANTALAALLCAASLALTRKKRSPGSLVACRMCAGAVILLASAALFEHWSGHRTGLSTLLAGDKTSPIPGLMSIQTACCFLLLGLSLIVEPTRQNWSGHAFDFLASAMILAIVILVGGYLYNAVHFIGQSSAIRTSPQTLACLILLIFVQLIRRAPHGLFSVIVGMGLGSQFAQAMILFSIMVSFGIIYVGFELFAAGLLSLPSAAAVSASCMIAIMISIIMLLARKINALEANLRESAISDELTQLYNLRGFQLLGEQLMLDAGRNGKTVSVVFFDADGLKVLNDNLGHEVGSAFLKDIASLLRAVFRASDILGRIGGDEFAVLAQGAQTELAAALRRFDEAVETANQSGKKPYRISCSVGMVSAEPKDGQSLTDLLAKADEEMYKDKKRRRAQRST